MCPIFQERKEKIINPWIFSKCPGIKILNFEYFLAEEEFLKRYTNLTELKNTRLIVDLTGQSFEFFWNLTKLDLRHCLKVTNEDLEKLTSLRSLDLRLNLGNYIDAIVKLPHLDTTLADKKCAASVIWRLKLTLFKKPQRSNC